MNDRDDPNLAKLEPLNITRIGTAALICVLILSLYLFLVLGFAFLVGRDAVICFELMNHRGVVGIPLAISLTMSFAFAASGAENSASGTFAFSNFSDKSEIDSFE